MSGSAYVAPGSPISSPPVYRLHGILSPKTSNPTSPSTRRTQSSSSSSSFFPSSGFPPSSPGGGTMVHSFGGPGTYLDPELLINKSPSDLPEGVDPSQREVGAEV